MQSYPKLIEMRAAHHKNAADLIAKLDEKKQLLVDARAEFEDVAGGLCSVYLPCVCALTVPCVNRVQCF